jgi:3-deoxy-D-manno-octulosonic-acid transferase
LLEAAGGLRKVADREALAVELQRLFASADCAQQQGAAAKQVVDNNRGALQRLLAVIKQALLECETV